MRLYITILAIINNHQSLLNGYFSGNPMDGNPHESCLWKLPICGESFSAPSDSSLPPHPSPPSAPGLEIFDALINWLVVGPPL